MNKKPLVCQELESTTVSLTLAVNCFNGGYEHIMIIHTANKNPQIKRDILRAGIRLIIRYSP